jgi:hypothetical protein
MMRTVVIPSSWFSKKTFFLQKIIIFTFCLLSLYFFQFM